MFYEFYYFEHSNTMFFIFIVNTCDVVCCVDTGAGCQLPAARCVRRVVGVGRVTRVATGQWPVIHEN